MSPGSLLPRSPALTAGSVLFATRRGIHNTCIYMYCIHTRTQEVYFMTERGPVSTNAARSHQLCWGDREWAYYMYVHVRTCTNTC